MWLHRYARLVAACTAVLIFAGGMVTSTESGLAVPDWPNTYGYFMFSFPLSKMVGGIFYEHTHRLIASIVGLLTVGLAAWLWLREPRPWVRRLGLVAVFTVVLQGVLGGITVLFFLPAPVSIGHAGLAQVFFCLTVTIAVVTSRGWRRGYEGNTASAAPGTVDDRLLARLTIGLTALLYAQILAGATMRHTGAGLAIPDFPSVFGGIVPPHWTSAIAIHYAHRIGALLAIVGIAACSGHVFYHHPDRRELVRPAGLLCALVAVQVTLGGLTVLSRKDPLVNSLHVVTGAFVLATSLVLTLRAHRGGFRDAELRASVKTGGRMVAAEAGS